MYYKTPTQHNVSMANALQRYVESQTMTIRHDTYILGIGQMYKYTIYKIQDDMMCKSYVPVIYMKIYLA